MAVRKPVKTAASFDVEEVKDTEEKVDLRTVEKRLVPERMPNGMWIWTYQPAGGEVPDYLKGSFTSINQALSAQAKGAARPR